jgi:hypothetical protein
VIKQQPYLHAASGDLGQASKKSFVVESQLMMYNSTCTYCSAVRASLATAAIDST